MKEILVRDLKKGDVYYRNGRYEVVLSDERIERSGRDLCIKVKCIMAPTKFKHNRGIKIGDEYYLSILCNVYLLVRDGKEVL